MARGAFIGVSSPTIPMRGSVNTGRTASEKSQPQVVAPKPTSIQNKPSPSVTNPKPSTIVTLSGRSSTSPSSAQVYSNPATTNRSSSINTSLTNAANNHTVKALSNLGTEKIISGIGCVGGAMLTIATDGIAAIATGGIMAAACADTVKNVASDLNGSFSSAAQSAGGYQCTRDTDNGDVGGPGDGGDGGGDGGGGD
jgi:hypothetical protein